MTETANLSKPAARPDNASYQAAVRGLIDRAYLRSLAQKEHWAMTDLGYAHPQLADFVGRLRRRLARVGIPIRVQGGSTSFDVVHVVHSVLGQQLTAKQWLVIAHLGGELSRQYRLHVEWGGPLMPTTWLHHNPTPGF